MNKTKLSVFALALLANIFASLLFFYYKESNSETQKSTNSMIHTIYDLNPLKEETKSADQDTLIIFDVSKVIFIKADPWERGYKKDRLSAQTINSLQRKGSPLFTKLNRKLRDQLWAIRNATDQDMLINPDIVDLINKLQERSVKIIALTRSLVGKEGQTPPLQHLRIKKLFNHGIDFSKSFSFDHPIIFNQFSYEKRHPVFEKGILFTTFATTKGKLLKAFFEKINWYPNKIIMIDDSIRNLKSVEEELKHLNIPFVGFEYKAAEKFPAYFNKEIAEFQMKHLLNEKKWLTAKEAAKRLNKEHLVNVE